MVESRDDRVVRDATAADASACAAIYAPYVTDTTISFESEPPDAAELRRRIEVAQARHAFLVLEEPDGQLVGYAYGGLFRERAAYRFSCEVSVYLAMSRRGSGGGRRLYEALLARLGERGFRTAAAGVTQPNDASARLHIALGFEPVGTYSRVGYKFGQWLDVAWYQRAIGAGADPLTDEGSPPPDPPPPHGGD